MRFFACLSAALLLLLAGWSSLSVSSADRTSDRSVLGSGEADRAADSSNWQSVTSVEELWANDPERLRTLLGALEMSRPGLEAVREAVQAGDTVAAGRALVGYYRESGSGSWLRSDPADRKAKRASVKARRMLSDTIDVRNGPVRIRRLKDGGVDWSYTGPNKDDEFGYNLNDHQYASTLLEAWEKTGRSAYAETFDRLIRDWIIHNPLPAKGDSIYLVLQEGEELDWRDIGEVRWRVLETGLRLGKSWPQLFYGFQQAEAFTPAARLLMLASLAEQAEYTREYHAENHNHALMEMNGLALTALAFPEFDGASRWFAHANEQMLEEMRYLVYPDGLSKELTSSYQIVALKEFVRFKEIAQRANKELEAAYTRTLERMHGYLAYSMRPDGHQPLNNDTDRRSVRERVLTAAVTYDRPDWRFVATGGASGERPEGLPSRVFPWAGIHVMRSGWDSGAHWAFFDTGPFGTAHQHADKLHLSVAAYGRDLLVDGGRYTYEDYWSFDPSATWRGYFRSTHAHNTLLIDGKGQYDGERGDGPGDEEPEEVRRYLVAEEPLAEGTDYVNTEAFDYARGQIGFAFSGIEGEARHTRAVVYVRGRFWVVVDRVETDRPRRVEALWHFAPHCTVELQEGGSGAAEAVTTDAGRGNLRIVPAAGASGSPTWKAQIVKGQTEPFYQGWYSADYGVKKAAPTVVYAAEGVEGPQSTFAWVLMPGEGAVPEVKAEVVGMEEGALRVRVEGAGREAVEVTVPVEEEATSQAGVSIGE